MTPRLVKECEYQETREALDIRWSKFLLSMGYLPVMIPIEANSLKFIQNLELKAVILTGGNDLFSFSKNPLSKIRDEFEKKLIENLLTLNIPILGICRGMQIITEYFSGKLDFVEGQVANRHKLCVNHNSNFANYLRKIKSVNSFHNHTVISVPKEFIISATNQDGVIKAIESKKHRIFCQMWHPEREEPFDKDQELLIKEVFKF